MVTLNLLARQSKSKSILAKLIPLSRPLITYIFLHSGRDLSGVTDSRKPAETSWKIPRWISTLEFEQIFCSATNSLIKFLCARITLVRSKPLKRARASVNSTPAVFAADPVALFVIPADPQWASVDCSNRATMRWNRWQACRLLRWSL